VPELPAAARELFKPVPMVPALQKEVGRQLEVILLKKPGLELER